MERIVFLDRGAIWAEIHRPAFEHEWIEYPTSRPGQLEARLEGATSAITNRLVLKGEPEAQVVGCVFQTHPTPGASSTHA